MKKILLVTLGTITVVIVTIMVAGIIKFNLIGDDLYIEQDGKLVKLAEEKTAIKNNDSLIKTGTDPQNTSYLFEEGPVALVNGRAETEIVPGSASKQITQYFGKELKADLNGDGREDSAFFLTQSAGGSGTFYYLAAALDLETGYKGTNAVFLGDRIIPQKIIFKKGELTAHYLIGGLEEPMAAKPTIEVSQSFRLDQNRIVPTVK